ncbi:transposase [Rhizobium leguminosarum]|nr:transposase [Rhizobium leguminosarum]
MKTGQLWAYARDERLWKAAIRPPVAHLNGLVGFLQVDGYLAYRALAAGDGVSLAFCWYELAAAGPALNAAKR